MPTPASATETILYEHLELQVSELRSRQLIAAEAYHRLRGELERERAAHKHLRAVADQSITDCQGIVNLTDEEQVGEIAEHIANSLGAALRGEPASPSAAKIITYKLYERCPVSGVMRVRAGHFPVVLTIHKHHVLKIPSGSPEPTDLVLKALDAGEARGSYATALPHESVVVWEIES